MLKNKFLHTHPILERLADEKIIPKSSEHKHIIVDSEDYQLIFKFLYENDHIIDDIMSGSSFRVTKQNKTITGRIN